MANRLRFHKKAIPMMLKSFSFRSTLLMFVVLLAMTTGCGKTQISGKVTLSDGELLTKGSVVFQSSAAVYRGSLDEQGGYKLDTSQIRQGVAKGSYKVYLSGAGFVPANFTPPPGSDDSGYTSLVDYKFTTSESTPLSYEVTGTGTFDFEVEKNKAKR